MEGGEPPQTFFYPVLYLFDWLWFVTVQAGEEPLGPEFPTGKGGTTYLTGLGGVALPLYPIPPPHSWLLVFPHCSYSIVCIERCWDGAQAIPHRPYSQRSQLFRYWSPEDALTLFTTTTLFPLPLLVNPIGRPGREECDLLSQP